MLPSPCRAVPPSPLPTFRRCPYALPRHLPAPTHPRQVDNSKKQEARTRELLDAALAREQALVQAAGVAAARETALLQQVGRVAAVKRVAASSI